MTTETVEQPEAEVEQTDQTVEADEAPKEPEFKDPMAKASFEMLANLIKDRNSKVGKINAVKGDKLSLLKELEENSTDPAAVEAREARDKAQEALDEAIMALHKAVQPEIEKLTADAEKSVGDIENEVKEADGAIKPGMTYFKKVYGEDLAKFLPSMDRLKGFSTKGAGSSGRRIRGYVVTVECDGEDRDFENVAGAAKYLEVETNELQSKFFAAAGNPEKLADAPDEVVFEVSYTDTYDNGETEEKVAKVTATRKPSDTVSEDDSDDDGDDSSESSAE